MSHSLAIGPFAEDKENKKEEENLAKKKWRPNHLNLSKL